MKKRLLWVGDATCPSGFAVATHKILDTLKEHYDVTVLGINYRGDPYDYPYRIYAAAVGGDQIGVGRILWMCYQVSPDVIVLQNDGWNLQEYVKRLKLAEATRDIPVVACVAVDGKNFKSEWLKGISLAIFWTKFALDEARESGYRGPAVVIPLGVDLATYYQKDKTQARAWTGIEVLGGDVFIVGNVNRNQARKRWDLTVKCFAEWITRENINDAWLYMHSAPTGDTSIDIIGLARYYNCLDRTVLVEPPTFVGITEDEMCNTYNCFDVAISTTQGEGMGLPAMEAMACGVPCLLPGWSAYSDWADGAAYLVPCSSTRIDFPYQNVIGGVVDEELFIDGLSRLYQDKELRQRTAVDGFTRVSEDRFRWEHIGAEYVRELGILLAMKQEVTA